MQTDEIIRRLEPWLARHRRPAWKPVVEETVALFGADRCLYGSNFPIEKLWTRYDTLVGVMRECLAGCTAAERRAIFHDTAARVYGLA